MVYHHYDTQIEKLISRLEELEKEIDSLRNEIKDKTIETNLYNTSSLVSEDTTHIEWEGDYGQQSF
jgi:prefoldin subunit 5